MPADDDLEDFIRLQKEKLNRERNKLETDDKASPRRQWDRSNPEEIKQSIKENIPVRSETPEIPLAAKLGQHEEKRKKLLEEKRQEYNQLQTRQGRGRRTGRTDDGGAVLPGLRDSLSAKQRKIAERNREYNEFLKSKGNKGRRNQPTGTAEETGLQFSDSKPSQKSRNVDVLVNRASEYQEDNQPRRPHSQNRATSPIQFENGRGRNIVPKIDVGVSGNDFGYEGEPTRAGGPADVLNSSLPIDDRSVELKRKEQERNREYNEFLKKGGGESRRGRRREGTPETDFDIQRRQDRSLGGVKPPEDGPRKGWGTPRYDEILEQKRRQESQYRQGAFTIRPAISEGALDQSQEEGRKLDRLDDVYENRKVRFRTELLQSGTRVKPILDDDTWLDFYKSPSRYDSEFDRLPRSQTTLDRADFGAKADRVKSAPLRDQGLPGRTAGNIATNREQYRLELEQQMKQNAENRRRERREGMAVNASGLTEITRQNIDIDYRTGQHEDAVRQSKSLSQDPSSLLNAAGQPALGPYNSPMDEAYYFYARKDPLDLSMDPASGYVPSVIDRNNLVDARGNSDESKRVSFGPVSGPTRRKNESDLVTAAAIPTLTEADQKGIQKSKANNYQVELQRQIEENRYKKKLELEQKKREDAKLEAEIAGYNPFGKGGGGAPLKDTQGNVLADLKQFKNRDGTMSVPTTTVPTLNLHDKPLSVYETYQSPRQPFSLDVTTSRTTGAKQEPTHARGGHGIFGDPKTDAQKQAADRYKSELQLQIEEKKRREEERKALQKLEEEKEMQRIEEARLKMQREYDEEVRKQKEKEENARKRNEELKLQAEEKRREAERLRREQDEKNRQNASVLRTHRDLDRERARITASPPVPALRLTDDATARQTTRRSPPLPAMTKTHFADPYDAEPSARLDRAGSTDVLSKLEILRRQLHSERERMENQLERDKYQVDVFDPRLVKAAPIPTANVPVIMSPPIVFSPPLAAPAAPASEPAAPPVHTRKTPDIDVFDTAVNKAPVTVKRPPAQNVNSEILSEFNQYKNRDTDSRQKFRQLFPDQPTSANDLEAQQIALLRQQEEELNNVRSDPPKPFDYSSLGSKTMLKSESEYIDFDGMSVDTEKEKEKRKKKKKVKVESPKSTRRSDAADIGSTTSLNSDMNRKNQDRLRKLRDLQGDDESLNDPDDILDRFISRQQHQRPTSGTTLNDEEAWLRPSN